MDSKTKITQAILETLNPAYTSNDLKEALSLWWINQRKKTKGGLKLTKIGFDRLSQGGLKFYQIQIEKIELITNQFLIWLDRFIDCPFIIVQNKIFDWIKQHNDVFHFSKTMDKYKEVNPNYLIIKSFMNLLN